MKLLLFAGFVLFMYIRRPVKLFLKNNQLIFLIDLYNSYKDAKSLEEKELAFELIAKNRPLTNDLIGSVYFRPPTYKDFEDERKIVNSYLKLHEALDQNSYRIKKYLLNPKYFIRDIFYVPVSVISFLLNRQFNKIPSLFLSSTGWIATILISAYATELRILIDAFIKKIFE